MTEGLRLHFEDLVSAARRGRLRTIVGRDTELRRMARAISRRAHNNVLVAGPPGVGKTALLEGFASAAAGSAGTPAGPFPALPIIRLDTAQCLALLSRSPPPHVVKRIRRAVESLPPCVVVIDELGALWTAARDDRWSIDELLTPFFVRPELRLLATVTDEEAERFVRGNSRIEKTIDLLRLSAPSPAQCADILVAAAPRLSAQYRIRVPPVVIARAADLAQHLPPARAMPDRALLLADEAVAYCALHGRPELTDDDLQVVAAERSGLPTHTLNGAQRAELASLEVTLLGAIRGQDHAVRVVSDILRRSWLGVRNPARPLGTFLFLGPSGVGKTECARVLSREVYGSEQAFVRLDLAEYQEPHTVQRLLGAPPGYIGHDAGGQLTTPISRHPFSLILLDELEKAHRNVHDVFLHLLDDGRLTDGKGTTVDFTKTIIITTSNLGANVIQHAASAGGDVTSPEFLRTHLLPILLQRFRPEFLNRFDAIVSFHPLSTDDLTDIALLELHKIEERFSSYRVRFRISRETLRAKAQELADPRFGARPLKRYVESLCERVVAERVFDRTPPRP